MNKRRVKIFAILIFFVAISTFLYFDAFATLTSYESTIEGNVKTTGAKFAVSINGTNIITTDGSVKNLDITSAVTSSTHIMANTVAPGSKLDIPLNINFYGSQGRVFFWKFHSFNILKGYFIIPILPYHLLLMSNEKYVLFLRTFYLELLVLLFYQEAEALQIIQLSW